MFQHDRHAGGGGGHFKVRPKAGAFGSPYVLTITHRLPAEVALSIGLKALDIRRFGGAGMDVIRTFDGQQRKAMQNNAVAVPFVVVRECSPFKDALLGGGYQGLEYVMCCVCEFLKPAHQASRTAATRRKLHDQ